MRQLTIVCVCLQCESTGWSQQVSPSPTVWGGRLAFWAHPVQSGCSLFVLYITIQLNTRSLLTTFFWIACSLPFRHHLGTAWYSA